MGRHELISRPSICNSLFVMVGKLTRLPLSVLTPTPELKLTIFVFSWFRLVVIILRRASSCSRTPSSYLSGPSTSSPKVRGRGKEMLQIQIDSKSLIDQLSVCIAKQVIRALELFRVFFNEQIRDGHMDPCSHSYPFPPEYPCFSYTKKLMKNVLFNWMKKDHVLNFGLG